MTSLIGYLLFFIIVLFGAGYGVHFSPSFTAMFLMVFLVSEAVSELFRCFHRKKNKQGWQLASHLLSIIGILFVFPSVVIYAVGDDWLGICIRISLAASLLLHLAMYLQFFRKQDRKMGIAAGLENWLLSAAAFLTLLCAVPSTALWPYGLGMLVIFGAKLLAGQSADNRPTCWTMASGMLLCTVFLVAPAVF